MPGGIYIHVFAVWCLEVSPARCSGVCKEHTLGIYMPPAVHLITDLQLHTTQKHMFGHASSTILKGPYRTWWCNSNKFCFCFSIHLCAGLYPSNISVHTLWIPRGTSNCVKQWLGWHATGSTSYTVLQPWYQQKALSLHTPVGPILLYTFETWTLRQQQCKIGHIKTYWDVSKAFTGQNTPQVSAYSDI